MFFTIFFLFACLALIHCQDAPQINTVFSKTCNQGDTLKVCEWGECCAIFTEFNVTTTTPIYKCMLYSQRIVFGEYYMDKYYLNNVWTEVRYDWEC